MGSPRKGDFGGVFRDIRNEPEIVACFERYRLVLNKPGAVLDELRAVAIDERLREGMTDNDWEAVLTEVAQNEWYQAEAYRHTLTFFAGNRERFESLLEAGRARLKNAEQAAQYGAEQADDYDHDRAVPLPPEVAEALRGAGYGRGA